MTDNLILLAEDNPDHALLTTEALASGADGRGVHVVRDGQELLDYLQRALEPGGRMPKLIILDLQMPGIDGFEVLRRVKQDERLRTIPIVVLTSSGAPEDIERSYDLGSNSYVQKPVEPGALHERVAEIPFYWFDVNALPPEHTS
jgi:CheY-like chemotaxis protein